MSGRGRRLLRRRLGVPISVLIRRLLARVEEHGCLVDDEVLVEAELAWPAGQGNRRVDAKDAVGDLVDVGAGFRVRDHGSTPIGCHVARMCNDTAGRYTPSACRHF